MTHPPIYFILILKLHKDNQYKVGWCPHVDGVCKKIK